MAEVTLHEKLIAIQSELKVPKTENNEFAGFKYRTLPKIEEVLKPILAKRGLVLTFTDEVLEVGGRVYVKAKATLSDGTNSISTEAYAREAVAPKSKMDDSQLTGSCSTYARKYAVGGMFLIDDAEDADPKSGNVKSTKGINTDKPVNKVSDDFDI